MTEESPKQHDFAPKTFTNPTWCALCGTFIWGLYNQGSQCSKCKMPTHEECTSKHQVPTCSEESGIFLQVEHKDSDDRRLLSRSVDDVMNSKKVAFQHEVTRGEFGLWDPMNKQEEHLMSKQIEKKILSGIKTKHKPSVAKAFHFGDLLPFASEACEKIVQDEFSICFVSDRSPPWNWNFYLFPSWLTGLILRYLILFPLRVLCLLIASIGFAVALAIIYIIFRNPKARNAAHVQLLQWYCAGWIASWSGVIRYHGDKPPRREKQVFVANHTTVFDIVVLMQHFPFSVLGQKHPGTMGFFQDYVLNGLDPLWFDRKDSSDRALISQKIRDHVHNPQKLPLLLFPEGTCVNNNYCVMFKKGAFELGATVYPIAIKYNKTFSDPFYNSREESFPKHLFRLLTSWAVVADVWFLEPQTKREDETTEEFSNRVKEMIAKQAALKNVPWDGYLKYFRPSEKFINERRKFFAQSIQKKYSSLNLKELEEQALRESGENLQKVVQRNRTPKDEE